MDWGSGITYVGETSLKGKTVRFGIKDADRLEGVSIMGKSPGRTELFSGIAIQDIERGIGAVIIDPYGEVATSVIERLSDESRERLIYLDPSEAEYPFCWNPLSDLRTLPDDVALPALSDMLISLYRLPVGVNRSALVEWVASKMLPDTNATLLTLFEWTVEPMIRDRVLPKGSKELGEFEVLLAAEPDIRDAVSTNGRYLAKDTLMRNLLGHTVSKFNLASLTHGSIVLDLSRIRMFPTRVTPLVRLFMHMARLAAHIGNPIALYAFESLRAFSDRDINALLTDKKIATVLSDSAFSEEEYEVRKRSLSRSGTVLASLPREGDARAVEELFFPYVTSDDVMKFETNELVVMLTIDGVRSRPFFAKLLPLGARLGVASFQDVQVLSREKYAVPRHTVDQVFQKKYAPPPAQVTEPGAFSSAFRSIFAKNAAPGGTPGALAPAVSGYKQASPPPPVPSSLGKADINRKPPEIPEEELKDMLHLEEPPFQS